MSSTLNNNSSLKTYNDLDKSIFKYFLINEDAFVYYADISFLPTDLFMANKGRKEVKIDKIDFVVKEILVNKNVKVQEFVEEQTGNVIVENRRFKMSKEGHSKNLKDFTDLCLSEKNLPTICAIEKFSDMKNCKEFSNFDSSGNLLVFSYLKDGKLFYTIYSDDDLLSVTFGMISKYNCVEIIYKEIQLERIFHSWGISSFKCNGKDFLLEKYMKSQFDKVYFDYEDFCLINIDDFDLIDFYTQTKQGKRLFEQWIKSPLVLREEIEKRLNITEYFSKIEINLSRFTDIKRMIARIENKTLNSSEMVILYQIITVIPKLVEKIGKGVNKQVDEEINDPLTSIYKLLLPVAGKIDKKINLETAEVDFSLSEVLQCLQKQREEIEREKKRELQKIKEEFPNAKIIKNTFKVTKKEFSNNSIYQTISVCKTGVTFTTREMEKLHIELENINKKINQENKIILDEIRNLLKKHTVNLEIYNFVIALIDVYKAFSLKCLTPDYCRPRFVENKESYKVTGMWHSAIRENPIKNDIEFTKKTCVLTGPNMGGKSTFIKTLSLISLYAQIGCYVPAKEALLPIFKRIIMRVGARDVSSKNMSTFMVEMVDLNRICRNKLFSLVLIDELGRGTSAIDGLSIIVAAKEHLKKSQNYSVITTHFSELNDEETLNKRMAVKEGLLTYKIEDGVSDNSFAINVAEMAKFPKEVIETAIKYLK
ncbi:DNA Mismatch repair protein [Nucleospora cyclopteri]